MEGEISNGTAVEIVTPTFLFLFSGFRLPCFQESALHTYGNAINIFLAGVCDLVGSQLPNPLLVSNGKQSHDSNKH